MYAQSCADFLLLEVLQHVRGVLLGLALGLGAGFRKSQIENKEY